MAGVTLAYHLLTVDSDGAEASAAIRKGITMSNEALTMRGPVHGTKDAKRVAVGSGVGAVIETYDFIGFGTAAALYFGTAFFPTATRSRVPSPPSPPWASALPPVPSAASSAATWATSSAANPSWSHR